MKKTKHSEEKMIAAVKQLEAGGSAKELARELGVTDQTLYNWRSKYSGMDVSDAKRLRALEEENRRLKRWSPISVSTKRRCRRSFEKTGGACEREAGRGVRHGGVPVQRTPGLQARRRGPQQLPI